jgi:hypothetical protein
MDTWSENGEDPEPVSHPPVIINTPKKTTANRNLIQKIEAIIASYELQEKYSTQLTVYSLTVIEKLIKTKPEFFRVVESTLIRNINGNILRANDVPYIISIIAQLYNLLSNLHIDNNSTEPPSDLCGYLLKFIVSVAVREKIVKIDDETEATLLLLCCDNIIEACTKLIKLKPMVPVQIKREPEKEKVVVKKSWCWCC